LHEEFASLLGVERIFVRQQGSEYFVTGDPNDTLLHPPHSPLSGRPRYEWDDQGNGILNGYSSILESAD
jgi:hypothetical protein